MLLENDAALLMRPAAAESPLILVGMNADTLTVIQLDEEGKTPFSVDFTDHSPSCIVMEQQTEDGSSMIIDKDGDGIPDVLIQHSEDGTSTERFMRESIDWKLGLPSLAESPDLLSRQIDWPLRALRIDLLFETPTETVAEKFAAFQDTLKKEYGVTLDVYLAPRIARQAIQGWPERKGTALPLRKASIEDTIRLFCDTAGCSYEVKDGQVLIKEGSANQRFESPGGPLRGFSVPEP